MSQTQRTSGRPATARPQANAPRRPGATQKRRPRRRSRLSRALTIGGIAAGILVSLSLVIVGAIYFRLSQGPISLQPLVASIEKGISADLGGITASIEDAQMMLGENGVEFRLTALELREADGDLVASAPLASASVSTTDLFWMRVTPKRVFLIEPRVYLFYSDDGGLALAFSPAKEDGTEIVAPVPTPAKRPNASSIAKTTQAPPSERIDLARKLIEFNERAQRGLFASAKLREIGVKDASAVLVFAGQTSEWKVPNFVIDLDRSKTGSSISGSGLINSGQGDWSFGFRTEEAHANNAVKLRVDIADLVPSSLAQAVPRLSLLKTLDVKVAGNGSLELAANGDVSAAKVDLTLGEGNIHLPNVAQPLHLDTGTIGLGFDGSSNTLSVTPSTLRWGQSFVTLTGTAVQSGDERTGDTVWTYQLSSKEGALAAADLGVSAMAIDGVEMNGAVTPKTGRIAVERAVLRTGGGEIALNGEITSGASGSNTRIEGSVANLKLDTLKAMWPAAFADGARKWVGTRLTGDVTSGTVRIVSGDFLGQGDAVEPGTTQRTSYAFEAANLKANVLEGAAPLSAPRALIRGENATLELNLPEAELPAGPKGSVQVKNAKFSATELGTIMPMGTLTFRALSPLAAAIELARGVPDGPLAGVELPVEGAEGKIDGQISVTLPLIETVQKQDVKVSGKVRLSELKAKPKPKASKVELQGGTINVDVTDTAAEAKGELIVNGVLAKLAWQHVLDVPEGMQSPVKITATLDNSDRTQLGLDLNHMVQGEVPVEVTLLRQPQGDTAIHMKADLTAAELILEDVAWTKPANRSCALDLDVGKTRPDGRIDLQNIKIVGDDVAIEGTAILDPDNEMRDFSFPRFSLGLISRLEVTGKQNAKTKIWQIKAKGPAYDGKSFIDTFFSMGRSAGAGVKPLRPAAGSDVEAEIETVFGYQQSALKNLKVKMSTRKEKVVALDATANLEGDRTFKAVISSAKTPRTLLAESNDAGRMFKVVGFYPNAQNGNLRVEVDLDGAGAAEKTGTLVVESFQVLGEPVFNELASSGQGQQRIQREVIDFDRMRIPFSIGHGQFVLSESYLRGPVMGMTLRGKIDYKMSRVNLGGTYIPLQGVNAAICDLPIFGQIVAGANCEGILGITFALQGSNKNPEVIVNPLSLVAPGIFRDIFQMTSPNPKIQVRDEEKPAAPVEKRTRSSSSGAASGSSKERGPDGGGAVDGWSSSDSMDQNIRKR